jgi:Flp pilus assembly protein TadD
MVQASVRLRFCLVIFCYLAGFLCPSCRGQSTPAPEAGARSAVAAQPPYDRLELLASVQATLYTPYLVEKIRARGIDFTPDTSFLQAVTARNKSTELMKTIMELKPQAAAPESSERQKAYLILVGQVGHRLTPSGKEQYQEALALAPNSAALHLAYAWALLLVPEYPGAEIEERRSVELWPGDAESHTGLAVALTGQGRNDEAIPEAREALRINSRHTPAIVELGMALTRDHQYKEAVPVLHEAISRAPEMTQLHKDLGLSLFNAGDIEGAISEDVLYLQANPNDADAHYDLGVAFRAQGHRDDALAQFREAARLAPSSPLFSAMANPSGAENGPQSAEGQRPDDGSVNRNIYTNKFFQFSLPFPEDWTVMGADAQRTIAKLGGEILAGSDQTLRDAQQAGAAHAYQLLFVTEGKSGAENYSTRSIQISALDSTITPAITSGEDFLKSSARLFEKKQTPLQATGPPAVISLGGRRLWRMDVTMRVNDSLNRASEIVLFEKGYLLLFVLSSPDQAGLDRLLQNMNSLRFSQDSN